MSKKNFSRAFIAGQYQSLSAKTNVERLKFTVAGIKNGRFYDHVGTDYGLFDEDAPDAIFISDKDVAMTRITGAKIDSITKKVESYFTAYYSEEDVEAEEVDDEIEEAEVEEVEEVEEEESQEQPEIDVDAVEKAAKKAIKKGDFKKAQKLIDKLDGKAAKKMQKKLDKAQ